MVTVWGISLKTIVTVERERTNIHFTEDGQLHDFIIYRFAFEIDHDQGLVHIR